MKWWLALQLVLLKLIGLGLVLLSTWDVLGWCVFFAGGFSVVAHMLLPRAQGLCDVVSGFEPKGNEIWLTIDDGPDPEDTPRILDLLDAAGAKATFFVIGERAERYPELIRMVLARGHTVGSHTYSHPTRDFWCAGRSRVVRELDRSLGQLQCAEANVRFFRAPVGIKNLFLNRALAERDLRCVAWSIRSGDGVGRSADKIVRRVTRELRPGAIVLLHEGPGLVPELRVTVIERVLAMLAERGYRCVLPEEAALRS